jgi:hypothetical protein
MSVLEVLQTCPTQWKSLLSPEGAIDLADTRLITFDLDSREPHLPTLVSFQIPVKIQNILLHLKITHFDSVASVVITSVVSVTSCPQVSHLNYKCCKCHKQYTSLFPMSCL